MGGLRGALAAGGVPESGPRPGSKGPPEGPVHQLSLQRAARSRHDSRIDVSSVRRPHPADLAFLQHPEELHLQGLGQLPDLVQKERAPMRCLKESLTVRIGAREGALHVPEELGFE